MAINLDIRGKANKWPKFIHLSDYSTAMFAIVAFDKTDEVDFLPLKWIADGTQFGDLPLIIKQKKLVTFFWPPTKNPESVSKAKSRCIEPELGWPTYLARIMALAGNDCNLQFKEFTSIQSLLQYPSALWHSDVVFIMVFL